MLTLAENDLRNSNEHHARSQYVDQAFSIRWMGEENCISRRTPVGHRNLCQTNDES